MVDPCTQKMKEQVQEELTAAMTYFAMVNIRDRFITTVKIRHDYHRQSLIYREISVNKTSL